VTLNSKLPSDVTTYNENAVDNVYNTFVQKICNTRIQEFLSAMKQQFAMKKGVAVQLMLIYKPYYWPITSN